MQTYKAQCPICDGQFTLSGIELSEIVSCNECKSRLVIKSIKSDQVQLAEAPAVEEDCGQ